MKNMIHSWRDRIARLNQTFYRLPYCVPVWGWAEHRALIRCLMTGQVIDGPDTHRMLQSIRRMTGVEHVFGFNCGKEAILAALKAAGIGRSDRVVMPSYCCETVASAVTGCGAEPIFCDIGDDLNPDVDHILRLIDENPRAVIFPHLFGNPGRIDLLESKLEERGIRRNIFVIDDAAQSFGAKLNGRLLGTYGDAGIVSLGAGKTMTASGGGFLITKSDALAEGLARLPLAEVDPREKRRHLFYWLIFRRWRRLSLPVYPLLKFFFRKGISRSKNPRPICNVDAAIGIEQLRKLDDFITIRNKRSRMLTDDLVSNGGGVVVAVRGDGASASGMLASSTKYILRAVHSQDVARARAHYNRCFRDSGVEIMPLYTPIHLKAGCTKTCAALEKTEKYHDRTFQVPVEPSMSDRDFQFIRRRFENWLRTCGKDLREPGAFSAGKIA
jgi:dTDP-4-amino-4,6-dideoxygalactose transaminase